MFFHANVSPVINLSPWSMLSPSMHSRYQTRHYRVCPTHWLTLYVVNIVSNSVDRSPKSILRCRQFFPGADPKIAKSVFLSLSALLERCFTLLLPRTCSKYPMLFLDWRGMSTFYERAQENPITLVPLFQGAPLPLPGRISGYEGPSHVGASSSSRHPSQKTRCSGKLPER
jgi:hypothetical protein